MLTITDQARSILRKIPKQPMLPPTAGLRIARNEVGTGTYRVLTVPEPRCHDHVIEEDGARIFLGPAAAERFRGHTLDARRDAHGRVEFVVKAA